MILAMHYFAAGFIILGITLNLQILTNVGVGILLGIGVGHWIQYQEERRRKDRFFEILMEEIKKRESTDEK